MPGRATLAARPCVRGPVVGCPGVLPQLSSSFDPSETPQAEPACLSGHMNRQLRLRRKRSRRITLPVNREPWDRDSLVGKAIETLALSDSASRTYWSSCRRGPTAT